MVMIKSRLTVASLILLNPLLLPPSLQCLVPSMYFINESGWLDPEARQRLRREDCSQKSPEHRDAQQTIPERERERGSGPVEELGTQGSWQTRGSI